MFYRWATCLMLLHGSAGAVEPWQTCAAEIERHHSVSTPAGRRAPLYQSPAVTAYLARLGRQATVPGRPPFAVLLLYDARPVCFAGTGAVYLSTAFLLTADSESTLVRAIGAQNARRRGRQRGAAWPACAALPPDRAARFEDVRDTLAGELVRYRDLLTPKLLRRPPPPIPDMDGN